MHGLVSASVSSSQRVRDLGCVLVGAGGGLLEAFGHSEIWSAPAVIERGGSTPLELFTGTMPHASLCPCCVKSQGSHMLLVFVSVAVERVVPIPAGRQA